jgi:hypothetical protein
MKRLALGILIGLGLITIAVAATEQRGGSLVQRAMPTGDAIVGSDLIVVPTTMPDEGQMLTVVAPRQQAICVYHIDKRGMITLKSARSIQWDLQVEDFNNASPVPKEIRTLLEQR